MRAKPTTDDCAKIDGSLDQLIHPGESLLSAAHHHHHRFSFDAAALRSTHVAASLSAQHSPIAEIRSMISPQLKASDSLPKSSRPRLLFATLQEYFEQGCKSVKAGRATLNRSDSNELFGWPQEEEASAAAHEDDSRKARTYSALDFEEQNPFTIGLNDDRSQGAASLFDRGASHIKEHSACTNLI